VRPENERGITRVRGNAANGEAMPRVCAVLWRWSSRADVSAVVEFGRPKPSAHARVTIAIYTACGKFWAFKKGWSAGRAGAWFYRQLAGEHEKDYRKIDGGSGPFRRPWPWLCCPLAVARRPWERNLLTKELKSPQGTEKDSTKRNARHSNH